MTAPEVPEPSALARSSPLARAQWERCVEALRAALAAGDDPTEERAVAHGIELPSPEAGELFVEVARVRGFACTVRPRGEDPWTVVVTAVRADRIELPHIHNVVMELGELAAPYDGDHVAWESVSDPPARGTE